jgi:hypothetical protein
LRASPPRARAPPSRGPRRPSARSSPLLSTAAGHPFDSFADVVEAGEHLEHIHAYVRGPSPPATETALTLELHTDQGLFIAFTPALLLGSHAADHHHHQPADFLIQLADGSVARAAFDDDALVFMMGEGAETLVGATRYAKLAERSFTPRATPHALRVPAQAITTSRLWYGRSVRTLPQPQPERPPLAITPLLFFFKAPLFG